MRDDEQICRKRGGIGLRFADKDQKITGKSAKTCIEKGAGQTTEVEIVCNELRGGCEDTNEIF